MCCTLLESWIVPQSQYLSGSPNDDCSRKNSALFKYYLFITLGAKFNIPSTQFFLSSRHQTNLRAVFVEFPMLSLYQYMETTHARSWTKLKCSKLRALAV